MKEINSPKKLKRVTSSESLNQVILGKKLKRVDSNEDDTLEFNLKETMAKKIPPVNTTSTGGTGGGGDNNFIYTPKRSIKKKDFKSRMQMIKTQSSTKQTITVKVLK